MEAPASVRFANHTGAAVRRIGNRLLATVLPPVTGWRYEGHERTAGAPLALHFAGNLRNGDYLARLAFRRGFRRIALRRRDAVAADLSVAEALPSERPGVDFFIPLWVGTEVNVVEALDRRHHSHNVRQDLRRVHRNGFTFEVSRDRDALRRFYRQMYLPYVRHAYGRAAFVRTEAELLSYADATELLVIRRAGEAVAGTVIAYGPEPQGWLVGVHNGDRRHVRDGALAAVYYFTFRHLASKGFTRCNLGASRPFLGDGVLQFKRKWGVAVTESTERGFRLCIGNLSPGVRSFLAANPFLHRRADGAHAAALFIENRNGLAAGELEEMYKRYSIPGIGPLQLHPTRPPIDVPLGVLVCTETGCVLDPG